ncbi:MAG TPA: helix-turn-helix domain-containing protein, partial [Candidatus Udaeobacter sp.]|nr:helix-turn-helix domain-containing protein [Candidatus Udaeobacter sp.]
EGEALEPVDLALDAPRPGRPGESALTLAEVERRHIENVLEDEEGHVERAAKRLGIPRSSLYQKLKEMGLRTRRRDPA